MDFFFFMRPITNPFARVSLILITWGFHGKGLTKHLLLGLLPTNAGPHHRDPPLMARTGREGEQK